MHLNGFFNILIENVGKIITINLPSSISFIIYLRSCIMLKQLNNLLQQWKSMSRSLTTFPIN